MDPQAALALINDTDAHVHDRANALEGLADWLRRGGYFPCGGAGESMHPTLTEEALETLSEEAGDLASAVRVALAYGDVSGL